MLIKDLQDGIVVKTKTGDFKLLKDGKLEELIEDDLMIRPDDVVEHTPVEITQSKPSADFYFSVEDEEDVNKTQNSKLKIQNKLIKDFIEGIADNIISESGVEESGQLRSVIISRLRDVRSMTETKEALARLKIDKEKMDLIVGLIEKKKVEVEKVIKTGMIDRPIKRKPKSAVAEAIKSAVKEKAIDRVEYKSAVDTSNVHQTTGAVGEIGNLSLDDFRKLGRSAKEAADRVMDKINLLEDESLVKKAEGIKAWQTSEVGKLYLVIGAEAMSSKKSIEQVIVGRKARGDKYLTSEEFDAVADLHRKLSY